MVLKKIIESNVIEKFLRLKTRLTNKYIKECVEKTSVYIRAILYGLIILIIVSIYYSANIRTVFYSNNPMEEWIVYNGYWFANIIIGSVFVRIFFEKVIPAYTEIYNKFLEKLIDRRVNRRVREIIQDKDKLKKFLEKK